MEINSLTSCLWFFLTVFWLFSLKLECDKLASEKSEMQRHYVMVRSSPEQSVWVAAPAGACAWALPELQGSQQGWNWLFSANGAVLCWLHAGGC